MRINEGSFCSVVFLTATEGFKTKRMSVASISLVFLIGVKHKKPDPPDFPIDRLFTVSSEDEWKFYRNFMLGYSGKEYELV